MKRLLLLILAIGCASMLFAQGPTSSTGIAFKVTDTTAYQAAAATAHSQGRADIYYNAQAVRKHFDIWNGSSYTHVFDFNAGGGGGAGTPQHSYDATGTNTYSTTIDAGNFDGYPGAVVFIKFANTNSGPSSLAVNGGGAVDIVYWDGDSFGPLPSGYLETEIIYRLSYSTIDDFFQVDKWDVTGAVTAVDGTVNRISIGGSAFVPVIDISSAYVGQTSITTLGTISTGTVPGTLVSNTPAGNIAATTAQAAINELDTEKADKYISLNTQTTNYTGELTDAGKKILMNSASSNTFTVPLNSSVAYPFTPDGPTTKIVVTQLGAGITTIAATVGVTLHNSAPSLSIGDQYASAILTKIGTDEWVVENGTASGVTAAALTIVNTGNIVATVTSGSPSTALLQPVEITFSQSGASAATVGGTGTTTVTTGDLLYGSATNTWSKLADVAAGSYLRSGGVTTAPLWSTLILPNAATSSRVVFASSTNTYGEDADMTFNGTKLDVTQLSVAAGSTIAGYISATATLDFPSTAAGTCEVLTITLTGAAVGDLVMLGIPSSIDPEGIFPTPRVSATNTVEVKFCNGQTIGALDPASGSYKFSIIK